MFAGNGCCCVPSEGAAISEMGLRYTKDEAKYLLPSEKKKNKQKLKYSGEIQMRTH